MKGARCAFGDLGRLAAGAKMITRAELRKRYSEGFMSASSCRATRAKHARVLHRLAGRSRKLLDEDCRLEFYGCIENFRKGTVSRIVPLMLLKNHARRFDCAGFAGQVYLNPHPTEIALRNRI